MKAVILGAGNEVPALEDIILVMHENGIVPIYVESNEEGVMLLVGMLAVVADALIVFLGQVRGIDVVVVEEGVRNEQAVIDVGITAVEKRKRGMVQNVLDMVEKRGIIIGGSFN